MSSGVRGASGSVHSTWELGRGPSPELALGNSAPTLSLGTLSLSCRRAHPALPTHLILFAFLT